MHVCRDPDDDQAIEAALAGDAGYVVTGDEDPLILERFGTLRFITPRDLLALLSWLGFLFRHRGHRE